MNNRRITVREIADNVGISFGSCQAIIADVVGKKHAAAKTVPKLLNFEPKQRRMEIAKEMLMSFNDDPDLLKKIITGDDTWIYTYDNETKPQSSQWKRPGEPRPKKAC